MSSNGNVVAGFENTHQSQSFLNLKALLSQPIEENIDCTLQETLTFILSDGNLFERTETTRIVFSSYFPYITSKNLFSHLENFVSAGYSLFKCLLLAIQDTLNDTVNLVSVLTNLSVLLEGCIHCINFLMTSEQLFFEPVVTFLKILEKSYQHCSECDIIYGETLIFVRDTLQNLIIQCHNLQTKLLAYLDDLQEKYNQIGNYNSTVIVSVMEGLFSVICPLAKAMEIKSTIPVWRAYFKLITKWKEILLGELDVCCVVSYLAAQVTCILEQKILAEDSTELEKNIKLCTFLFKLIVSLCDKFNGHLKQCIKDIVNICTTLMKFFPQSYYLKDRPTVLENIKRVILIGMDPLVESLLSDKSFAPAVLELTPNCSNSLQLSCFYIIILDCLINSFDNVNEWFPESSPSLFSRLLLAFELSSAECMTPIYFDGVMHKGKPQELVSYFHFVCVHVCAFISCLSPDLFQIIESLLFNSILGTNPFVVILASDILCFIARFSTSELCYSHFKYIASILLPQPNPRRKSVQHLHLCSLVRRLFSFLSKTDQRKALSEFSDIQLMSSLKVDSLQAPLTFVGSWSKLESLEDLNCKFAFLKAKSEISKALSKDEEIFIFRLLEAVANESVAPAVTEHVLSSVLKIMRALVNFERKNMLMDVVQQSARKGSESAHLLLMSCYHNWMKNSPQLSSSFVYSLARCTAISLNGTNFWLQELAFEHFGKISHPVLNEDLIRQTLKMCSPYVTSLFKDYMRMFISKESTLSEEKIFNAVKETAEVHVTKPCTRKEDSYMDIVDTTESNTKRTCETGEISPPLKKNKMDKSFLEYLQGISKAVDNLETVGQNSLLDEPSKQEVHRIITRLQMLL